jgi:hypothetical protein
MQATTLQRVHAEFENAVKQCGGISPCAANPLACLMAAFVAAMPVFIQAFLECKAGTTPPPTGAYDPGQRTRCPD